MNVLHLTNHFYPCQGGIEKYVKDLCKFLVSNGFKSDVLCLNTCSSSKEKLKRLEDIDGTLVMRVDYKDLKYYKLADVPINKLKMYDIIHIHNMGFFLDFVCLTKFIHKKPIIFSTGGGIFHTEKLKFFKKVYFNTIFRLLAKSIDKTIAISSHDKEIFKFLNPSVIPPSVSLIERNGVRKEKNSMAVVGRLSSNKRVEDVLYTAKVLSKKTKNFKIYIAGKDWHGSLEKLKKLSKSIKLDNNVVFLGEISDREKEHLYRKCDIFLSASLYEGFGISLVEAMSAGCIPIVNSIDSYREILENNERLLTNFTNHKETANKIYKLMNSKERNEILEYIMKRSEDFGLEKTAKKIIRIYEDLK